MMERSPRCRPALKMKSEISRNGDFFAGRAMRAQISSEIRSLKSLPEISNADRNLKISRRLGQGETRQGSVWGHRDATV